MKEFELKGSEFIELNKLLKLLGLADTGGEANIRITEGEVKVNEITETQKRKKLRSGDIVVIYNEKIRIK